MRKIKTKLISLLALTFCLAGCSKNKADEFGWYHDLDAAKTAACKENKDVILLFTRDDSDGISVQLKENLFNTEEFKNKFESRYIFCNLDLSLELFSKARPDKEKATFKDKMASGKYSKILDKTMYAVTVYNMNNTPAFLTLTKQGYVISRDNYVPLMSVNEFEQTLAAYEERSQTINSLVDKVDAAKGLDKVRAIDELCGQIKYDTYYLLTPYMRQVEKLDRKNETGLVGKYILRVAASDTLDCYMNRKQDKLADSYLKAAENKLLTDLEKQQAYYSAAFIISSNTPEPETTVKIIDILKKGIAVNPDSELGKQCQMKLAQMEEFKIRQDEGIERRKAEKEAAENKNSD